MKPAPFAFCAPRDLAGVLDALAEHGEDGRILAGGQSLVPLINLRLVRPEMLISINRCDDLDYLRLNDGHLVCGARVRQATAEESDLVQRECPLLAKALPYVGGQANRNRGTVCGSLAHGDPLAELAAVALALDGEMHIAAKGGGRSVPAANFFLDGLATAVGAGEMLEAVAFQRQGANERSAFLEMGNRKHGFAVAAVAVRLGMDGGHCDFARIAMLGASEAAQRIGEAEDILTASNVDETTIEAAVAAARAAVRPPSDLHADAEFRRHVLGALLGRALRQAMAREAQ
jgi:CO/xanthine dehydrogenase FAD-binding subunit